MNFKRRTALAAGAAFVGARSVRRQDFPSKPIKIVVPFAVETAGIEPE